MDCPWCGVETRASFERCIECGRDIHRPPPPPIVAPAGTVPFGTSADCSLQRRTHGGSLVYLGLDGLLVAIVADGGGGPLRCRGLGGEELFAVTPYEPGGHGSMVVVDPDDADRPLGTYDVLEHVLEVDVVVRDAASAPVARLAGSTVQLALVETGGAAVASIRRDRHELDEGWTDDRWTLSVTREPPTLERRALVASLVVCHQLLSARPKPPVGSDVP